MEHAGLLRCQQGDDQSLHGELRPAERRPHDEPFVVGAGILRVSLEGCCKNVHEDSVDRRKVLQINMSKGLSDMGELRPELVGCVICVFVMLYFSLFKGVKSSGKVAEG